MIKISELFSSLQGEGLYTGVPSIFLRTFACNFRCPGYGRPPTEIGDNQEVQEIIKNIDQYKTFEELPLVKTGCDTYAAVYPEFKRFSKFYSIDEIVEKIKALLPQGVFGEAYHLVMTGGEPLLAGWQSQYPELLQKLFWQCDLRYVTFETNGTQHLTKSLQDFILREGYDDIEFTFSISSKVISSSGEAFEDTFKPDVIKQYRSCVHKNHAYFKWVISNLDDWKDVLRAKEEYSKAGIDIPTYLMPAGGTQEVYNLNKVWVEKLARENGLRFSQRLQCDLHNNGWGT